MKRKNLEELVISEVHEENNIKYIPYNMFSKYLDDEETRKNLKDIMNKLDVFFDIEMQNDEKYTNLDNEITIIYNTIRNKPILSFDEIKELFNKYKAGDKKAKEKIIESNLKLVFKIAINFSKYTSFLKVSDLYQEGYLGLDRAVETYDPSLGYRFTTWATLWIRQSIQRARSNTEREIRIPVHQEEYITKINKFKSEFISVNGYSPSVKEIAEHFNDKESNILSLLGFEYVYTSIESPITEEENSGTLEELLIDNNQKSIENIVQNEMMHKKINKIYFQIAKNSAEYNKLSFINTYSKKLKDNYGIDKIDVLKNYPYVLKFIIGDEEKYKTKNVIYIKKGILIDEQILNSYKNSINYSDLRVKKLINIFDNIASSKVIKINDLYSIYTVELDEKTLKFIMRYYPEIVVKVINYDYIDELILYFNKVYKKIDKLMDAVQSNAELKELSKGMNYLYYLYHKLNLKLYSLNDTINVREELIEIENNIDYILTLYNNNDYKNIRLELAKNELQLNEIDKTFTKDNIDFNVNKKNLIINEDKIIINNSMRNVLIALSRLWQEDKKTRNNNATLQLLAYIFEITRERVRQIESGLNNRVKINIGNILTEEERNYLSKSIQKKELEEELKKELSYFKKCNKLFGKTLSKKEYTSYRKIIDEINMIRNVAYNYAKNNFESGYLNVIVPKDIIKFNSFIGGKINSIYLNNKNVTYKDIDEFLKNIENKITKKDVLKYLENNQMENKTELQTLIKKGMTANIKEAKELLQYFEKFGFITFESKVRNTLKLAKECSKYNGKRVSLDIFLDYTKKREKDISYINEVINYIDETDKKRYLKINKINNTKTSSYDLKKISKWINNPLY